MPSSSAYQEQEMQFAAAAIAKGHQDPGSLRELLICTTSKTTYPLVNSYFHQHHHDKELLEALFLIAMEGEDVGDAPWAAANTIADFPGLMLREHKAELLELSKHEWMYLKVPAQEALNKIAGNAT